MDRIGKVRQATDPALLQGGANALLPCRTIEMTEALRGVHVAILRRLRVFDESLLHQATDGSPLAQWKAFIANEERRRTAMACFGKLTADTAAHYLD